MYFTVDGIAYLLEKLILVGYRFDGLTDMHDSFINYFAIDSYLFNVLNELPLDGILELKKWFEYLLFDLSESELSMIRESYLFRNLEKIESFLETTDNAF